MKRYHPKVGLPANLKLPNVSTILTWTRHAEDEVRSEGVEPPRTLHTSQSELFEVVTDDNGQIVKLGYRVQVSPRTVCCLVVRPERRAWVVITGWLNGINDHHSTLRKERYDLP